MNKKITTIILLLSVLFAAKQGIAQKLWTLPECVKFAQDNSIYLKQQALSVDIQEITLTQSKAQMLPTLNANASYGVNWGKSVDRFTNQFADQQVSSINLYLQSELTVFSGFRLLNTIKKNQINLKVNQLEYDNALDMKGLEVATAYLQVLYAMEDLKVKQEQLDLTKMQVDRTEKFVEAGSIAKGDLLNIRSQWASENAALVQSQNQLAMAYLELRQLMDLPSDTSFAIAPFNPNTKEKISQLMDARMVYDYAIQNRPDIKSAALKVEASQKDLDIARGSYSPSLSLTAGIGTGYSGANTILDGTPSFTGFNPNGMFTSAGDTVLEPMFSYNQKTKLWSDQFTDNKNYSVGLYLRVPIFNNLQTKSSVEQAKIGIKQAELQLEQSKQNLRKTIEQSYTDAAAAANKFVAAEAQLAAQDESFKYATQKFEAGVMNAFEYNEAKIKFQSAQSQLINAKYEYVFRMTVLDFYYGRPLSL